MIRTAFKLLLLSWAITARLEDEFEEPEDARSVPPKNEIVHFPHPKDVSDIRGLARQPSRVTSEATKATASLARPPQTVSQQLKGDAALLFKAMEACRESHPSMSNRTFNLRLYGGLLDELTGVESEASKAALRRCNISEALVGKLKAKLSQLEIVQDVFVLVPRNSSSESPPHGKTTQQPHPPPSTVHSHRTLRTTPVQNNLKLKLGDEWISLQPKVSHLSHIYLGSSIYPMLTEESRVLDKDHTVPAPAPTEDSVTKETHSTSARMNDCSSAGREIQRQQLDAKLRLRRSADRKAPNYPDSNPAGSRPLTEDAPDRLFLFPRKSYRWHIKESDNNNNNRGIKCPLDLKLFGRDARYKMIYKLCSAILQHFRKFLKANVSWERANG